MKKRPNKMELFGAVRREGVANGCGMVERISFDGAHYRRDIGVKALR